MLVCVSHESDLLYMDQLGEQHDNEVHKWCKNLEDMMIFNQVYEQQ